MPLDLFGSDTPTPPDNRKRRSVHQRKDGSWRVNPMTFTEGLHEPARKCKDCRFLVVKEYAGRYYKCRLRGNVDKSSPASDHRYRWPACGRFERDPE